MRRGFTIRRRYPVIFSLIFAMLLLLSSSLANAAAWTVTNAADENTPGTLRNAFARAADGDTINFSRNDFRIELTSNLKLTSGKLTIIGPCVITQKDPNASQGLFIVYEGADLTLNDVTLTGGYYRYMGPVINSGKLTMTRCAVTGNKTGSDGRGVVTNKPGATLRLTDCVFESNSAWKGGAVMNWEGATATMSGCAVRNNTAGEDGGGITNWGTMNMMNCTVSGNTSGAKGGGVYTGLTARLFLMSCVVTNNTAKTSGGGIYYQDWGRSEASFILSGCTVSGNAPDQITGRYTSDGSNQIGNSPNRQATAFSGYAGDAEPAPRSIIGDADIADVSRDLADPDGALVAVLSRTLSSDLGRRPGGTDARLHYANTFENVAVTRGDLTVEYTASWPENARYYALFSRADGSGYELPERGVQFEIRAGQTLPDGVTPPDFYEAGEGLMTWRAVVTDNGSYDLEPAAGVVTFRVCSVRAAEAAGATGDAGSGGGCNSTGFAPLALLLVAPLLAFAGTRRNGRRR